MAAYLARKIGLEWKGNLWNIDAIDLTSCCGIDIDKFNDWQEITRRQCQNVVPV